jgi:predicted TIM-barrel fold metal-dependent hydrolase
VSASQILFGTDFPPGGSSQDVARQLAQLGLFDQNALRAIDHENAAKLLPRLRAAAL